MEVSGDDVREGGGGGGGDGLFVQVLGEIKGEGGFRVLEVVFGVEQKDTLILEMC